MRLRASISAISTILALSLVADAANAACTRLAFSVNDYGKDGPTKDAKDLLDKYVAKWTAERGIKKYNTGKKDVTCELFLDVGLFDEHTCKAAATVCWEGKMPVDAAAPAAPGAPKSAAVKPSAPVAAGATAAPKPKAAATPATSAVTTGSVPPAAAPAAIVPAPAMTLPTAPPVAVPKPQ
jgi:hypothetical protein